MVRLTLIARVHDGLPLAEGLDGEKDRDLDNYKLQAKVGASARAYANRHTVLMVTASAEHCTRWGSH